ncbi:pilus assembly protein PilY [Geotalea daltonii]|nr:pilus assembly protein PilY [Geotalea daltonii]
MFEVGRDHKLYYSAYNDAADIDDDGQLETGYKHTVDYYGYFDAYKCYTHSGGSGANDKFTPVSSTPDKFCAAGQWSGNVLNWITMSRSDVLRRVLFGGHRSQDSTSYTELERVPLPQDAHSWGKELTGRLCYDGSKYTTTCNDAGDCASGSSCVDKSVNLIGFAAADAPSECPSPVTVNWTSTNQTVSTTTGNILIAKYKHPNHIGVCGDYSIVPGTPAYVGDPGPYEPTITDTIYGSFEASSANFISSYYISDFNFADTIPSHNPPGNFTSPPLDVLPSKDHGQGADLTDFNFLAVTEFNVTKSTKGDWEFMVDGDDGVELLIDGQLVAFNGGCHSACSTAPTTPCSTTQVGTINLLSGYHRLLVRHSESTGQDGIKVWYKNKNTASWTIFGGATLTLRAPAINSTNVCSIKSQYFIDTGTPVSGTAKRHLFCNTTLSKTGSPIVRLLKNMPNRIWEWSAKERPVCDASLGTPTDLAVRVEVCNAATGVESWCKDYNGTYKPTGLLQKYGEGDGAKVCSKTFFKPCTTDTDCGATEGLCIYKAPMYFGLMTGSYTKNQSGGVLRKNPGSVLDETNANNGIFQTSENVQGNIIHTLDRMAITNYNYSTGQYDNCGWVETGPPIEGMCENWGNPVAEMMYESLRYFSGKRDGSGKFLPTPDFTYGTSADMGLSLSKPDWGYPKGSNVYTPYEIYPSCAKPFVLFLSDINPSYDTDQVPGSSFASYTEDLATPKLNVDVSALSKAIGTQEAIAGNNWFVGQSGSTFDMVCSSKGVSNLDKVRGLCPEEPTKKGGYYAAALAYYGKTLFNANSKIPDVTTFAVALASPVAELKIKVGANSFINFVPVGKSLDGCLGVKESCAAKCTFGLDAEGRFTSSCPSDAFCPTNQIVNDFVEKVQYDNAGNVIYAKFRLNYEDSEQGADHDMDAIVSYEICTPASVNMSDTSCTEPLSSGQLEVKLSSEYASGCIDQALGFVVSGTTADGLYLPVKDKDVSNASKLSSAPLSMPLAWQKVFTVNGTGSIAGFLKNPLWYAAKWGGFVDSNSNNMPDLDSEWNKGGTGNPDNYFLAVNPLKLEQQLDTALNAILARVSSGTAASVLSNSEGSGANILQAVFYPRQDFDNNTSVNWIGEMQNLWYYIDPYFVNSNIREDSDFDHVLNLSKDKVIQFFFSSDDRTMARRFVDPKLVEKTFDTIDPDAVRSLWRAGLQLWERDLSAKPRKIYTSTDSTSLINFSSSLFPGSPAVNNSSLLQPYLQATTVGEAESVINYIHGVDNPPTYRSRTVSINKPDGSLLGSHVWKLGDIVSSTPRLQSTVPLNSYNLKEPKGYRDKSYGDYSNNSGFIYSNSYQNRGMVYVGANDGMLHAFKLGKLEITENFSKLATLSGEDLGNEEWAYVPKNVLPYLKYLAEPSYNHIYFVDGSTSLFDISTAKPTTCSTSDYWNCQKDVSSWKTVLIGGMGIGGASKAEKVTTCTDKVTAGTCVKTPIMDPADGSKGLGYSSYFALDITEQYFTSPGGTLANKPKLLWEFSDPALGFATSGPAIIKINGRTGGVADPNTNGRWLAVFASGPTGPIDTASHQFKGVSDQNLQLFVVDLEKGPGAGYWKIDTGVPNAFAGSLSSNVVDTDRLRLGAPGNYQDDALYVGYVKKAADGSWADGGVLRVVIPENTDPSTLNPPTQWQVSRVMDGIGPVTTSIATLQGKNLYLFFGTGRFYYPGDDPGTDAAKQRRLFGIQEPCYKDPVTHLDGTETTGGDINDNNCSASLSLSDLTDQTSGTANGLSFLGDKGWYINLDLAGNNFNGERVITNPSAVTSGNVYFTSFKPTEDICSFGGTSYLWAVNYYTGLAVPSRSLVGKALVQVSTGSFEEVDLPTAFTDKKGRRMGAGMTGKPSLDAPPIVSNVGLDPLKRILHVQEH